MNWALSRGRVPLHDVGAAVGLSAGIALLSGAIWNVYRVRAGAGVVGAYVSLAAFIAVGVTGFAAIVLRRTCHSRDESAGTRRLVPPFVGLAVSVSCFMTTLVTTWRTSRGLSVAIGGVVPWSDASLYFGGAERLLFFGHLDAYNSRHPLNALFLADRLAVTNLNLRTALLLQAILLGVASYLAARAVARDLGVAAGIAVFAAILAFGQFFVATTMTEALGLVVGVLAFSTLWHSVRVRGSGLALAGLGLLAVALAVRDGPLPVLVVLIVWFARYLRQAGGLNWRFLGVASAVGIAGLALNYAVVPVFGGYSNNVNGNSSFLLYGMARGYPGWQQSHPSWNQVFFDYPHLKSLSDPAANQFVQRQARDEVLAHPLRFTGALARSTKNYAWMAKDEVLRPLHNPTLRWLALLVPALAGGWIFVRRWRVSRSLAMRDLTLFAGVILSVPLLLDLWPDGNHKPSWMGAVIAVLGFAAFCRGTSALGDRPQLGLAVAAVLGFIASVPIVGVDTVRVFAAVVPLAALPIVVAVATVSSPGSGRTTAARATATPSTWYPASIGLALLVVMLLGTPIAMAVTTRPHAQTLTCPDHRAAQSLIGGVAVHVVTPSSQGRGLEDVAFRDYVIDSLTFLPVTRVLDSRKPPVTVLEGLRSDGADRIAIVPGRVTRAPERSVVYLCGDVIHDPQAQLILQYWPQPFDFFSGRPLVRNASASSRQKAAEPRGGQRVGGSDHGDRTLGAPEASIVRRPPDAAQ